ncbi:DUF1513 domain-containing protein [Candidatus Accumulibacter sp. ACC003]|uniref:DUF1513 domain-containing protein n=1 Tax=Candidatus Accumulibacter sp. ACC003 TaxID=2823334 RepID=UPI00344D5B93
MREERHPDVSHSAQSQARQARHRHLEVVRATQGSGQGLIGLRDVQSMSKLDEWRSHGLDPHQMLVLPQALMGIPAGALLVANGGIPTQAESGRGKKVVADMDSSLVALDSKDGQLLGQ